MILPLGDSPNPRGVPFVNYALLAANVAVYVLVSLPLSVTPPDPSDPLLGDYLRLIVERAPPSTSLQQILSHTSAYDVFVFRYGYRPVDPSMTDLFFSLFLHSGFFHLAGNMLFLWIYGDNVEHRLGRMAYLAAYLGAGVAATLFHSFFEPGSPLPLIGASGAISGVLGFYFLWFPHNQVRLLFLLFPFFLDVITIPARILLGLYLVVDNLFPFLLTRGTGASGVAYGAHIGGFLGGLAIAWFMDRRELIGRPREFRSMHPAAPRGSTDAAAIRRALAEGRFAQAAEDYFALPPDATKRVLVPEESLALAEWLRRNEHGKAALAVYRRHLRDYPNGPSAAEAHFGAGIIQLESLGEVTPAYQHFLDALDLDPSPETARRVRTALDSIATRQKLQVGRPRRRAGSY